MTETERLEFGVLGPLGVQRGENALELGGAKQRALLALLLLNANQVVSTDKLIDDLWGESPPPTALSALQVHVSQLRRLLEPNRDKSSSHALVVTRAPGYVIQLAPDQLDLHRFERLAGEGIAALADRRPAVAAGALKNALQLWRGPALADLAFEQFAQVPATRLEEMRLAALEKRIEADLACGRHAALVGELQELAGQHPLREELARHLMLALYRSGRQADALVAYQRTRRTLVDELGIDPGPALQRLEHDILVHDPSLELEARPALLPSGEVTFVLTDIEDSTELLHRLGDAYASLLTGYRRLVRESFGARGGQEVDRQGDGLFFVFPRASDAAEASIDCQRLAASSAWPSEETVRIRIGLHTGTPSVVDDGYVGLDVHRAARVGAAAHGGQIVVSEQAATAIRGSDLDPDLALRELGSFELKGLPEPVSLFQLVASGLATEFPAPRVASRVAVAAPPSRSVLVISPGGVAGTALVSLAAQLALGPRPHELVLAHLVDPSESARLPDITESLGASAEELARSGASVRLAAFTSNDVPHDIERLAARSETDLLLAAAGEEVLPSGSFDATLRSVLEDVLCDVAFLLGRGLNRDSWLDGPVIVPFGADPHDWAALELGAWLAKGADRPLHMLGTVADAEHGTRDASRLIADAGLLIQRASGVVPVPKLVEPGREGPVTAAADGGLLVIGLSDNWQGEGLGMTRWAIARTTASPVLFVRRGLRPGGLAPDASVTRFAWSVTVGA